MKLVRTLLIGVVGLALIGTSVLTVGCKKKTKPTKKAKDTGHFTLQLLHISDMESNLNAIEDAPRISSMINIFKSKFPKNTLLLSSGDNYLPGPFYLASANKSLRPLLGRTGKGRADILLVNAMGFQVSALGNHEFDQGPKQIASLIKRSVRKKRVYEGAKFPYISANLDVSTDKHLAKFIVKDGQEASKIPGKIARSVVITVNGQKIGIVGATTPTLGHISSVGDVTVLPKKHGDLDALVKIIQTSVDALTKTGINKIILLSHMQDLTVEEKLAGKLKDVDIIIGGGSDSILADENDRLREGDKKEGSYPIWKTSANKQPIAIVNTDGQYRYLGRLVLKFDKNGVVVKKSVNSKESGAFVTDKKGAEAVGPIKPNKRVLALVTGLKKILLQKDSKVFGKTKVYLNGLRVGVRREETNFGNLSADANLFVAKMADPKVTLSLRNGGGIRNSVGVIKSINNNEKAKKLPPAGNRLTGKKAGEISQLDIENALQFNNPLVLLTLNVGQLKEILEHSVATWGPKKTVGRFLQISGFTFSFDPSQPAGKRIVDVTVTKANGKQMKVFVKGKRKVSKRRTFRIVTIKYMAKGGDGFPFKTYNAKKLKMVSLLTALKDKKGKATFSAPGSSQDALAEYLLAKHPISNPFDQADTPASQDKRVRNLMYQKPKK